MDVQMPEMDGPTAARAIRAKEAETGRRRTPIIALTANVMSDQVAAYRAAGMDGFVSKPLQVSSLVAAIRGQVQEVCDPARPDGALPWGEAIPPASVAL
jgi:CheY-like chemotaxis protein